MTSTKAKPRSNKQSSKSHGKALKGNGNQANNAGGHQSRHIRRSSAELLRKNHPYSSSTEDDSDSGHVNDKEMESAPQLPPRRGGNKNRQTGIRNSAGDGNLLQEKSLEEVRHFM